MGVAEAFCSRTREDFMIWVAGAMAVVGFAWLKVRRKRKMSDAAQ
jgi:hypothetical protein